MADVDVLATKAVEAGSRLRVRSALNPILWLCAIISVPSIVAAAFSGPSPLWLILLAAAPIAAAIFGFLFLLVVDRDKLQSEEYQIQKRSLEIIEQKGDAAPLIIDPSRLVVVEKSQVLPSPSGSGEQK